MSHYITEPCIGTKDASCVEVCPVDCIHPRPESPEYAREQMLYIDPGTCIDCGLCVDECPVAAIYPEHQVPRRWAHFVDRNAAYFRPADDRRGDEKGGRAAT